jgi:hypothetical protein
MGSQDEIFSVSRQVGSIKQKLLAALLWNQTVIMPDNNIRSQTLKCTPLTQPIESCDECQPPMTDSETETRA